ncbi:O-antigen ligase family protein [Oxalobacteraceae bacterium A2-2]
MNNTLSTLSFRPLLVAGLIFLLPCSALLSSAGVGLCSFGFLLAAIVWWREIRPVLQPCLPEVRGVLIAFGLALLVPLAGLLLREGAMLRDLEKPSRMLAAASVMLVVLLVRPSRKALWWGLIAGTVVGAAYIAWQRWHLGIERPGGGINSITYGDVVLCMGLLSLAGTLDFQGRQAVWPGLGALAGLVGSIATGTRGGWIALLCAAVLFIQYGHVLRGRFRKGLLLASLVLLVSTYFIPQTGARDRIHQGVSDVEQYFDGGNRVTNIGVRFELWRGAAAIIARHPLLGASDRTVRAELTELVGEKKVDPYVLGVEHFHNEILQVLVYGGVLGLLVWGATVIMPFLFFLRMLRGHATAAPGRVAPALAGLLLVVSFFSFGLTEVIFWSVRGAIFYALMLFLLMGLCLNAREQA